MKLFILLVCIFVGNCNAFGNFGDLAAKINPMNMIFSNSCMEDLGCFYTGPPFFNPLVRPLSVAPVDRPKPKFMLYTKTNPNQAYILETTTRSLQNSPFDPSAKIKFFIHGFKFPIPDTHFKAKDELLKLAKYNVFIVDWTQYNSAPYDQAVANTRVIGAVIARMIKFLVREKGISPSNVHLIGHSLGAHIAGYAGERMTPKVGRITGLDPAGPFFQGLGSVVCLDPTDAVFVDAIHTNGAKVILNGLGMNDPVGHMDFYPNGGSQQPGCGNATGEEAAPTNDPTAIFGKHKCHHMRANRYFLESINSRNTFQSSLCNSYADFQSGRCRSSAKSPMGLFAQKIPRLRNPAKFYTRTSAAPPYSL